MRACACGRACVCVWAREIGAFVLEKGRLHGVLEAVIALDPQREGHCVRRLEGQRGEGSLGRRHSTANT